YAGIFGVVNVPDEALPPFLLIEAPRLLFPFARQVIAEATANTGFPPLLLDPIDFASAYMAQVDAAQQQLESQDQGAGELTGEGTGEALRRRDPRGSLTKEPRQVAGIRRRPYPCQQDPGAGPGFPPGALRRSEFRIRR